ncbi:K02A2.6-like [Cordylochernes scorpioides]|uniref:RNA-directed DNA polymerase n=1 Tax=Cordylochernes scorpioides TaxID=51811 RepID=A0ABY6JVR3_9ARAC|nr:K02A2.6-like [Cordylochernes scorpioides]
MTVRQIEETLGIPKTTVDRIMREHLGLRKLSARWVPKLLPSDQKAGQTITGNYYAILVKQLREAIKEKRRGKLSRKIVYHQDNAPSHRSLQAMAAIYDSGFKLLPHAPYSPDLALSDFHLFPHLKKSLSAIHFRSDEEVIDAVTSFFESLETSFFLEGIKSLEHRWKRFIDLKGDYDQRDPTRPPLGMYGNLKTGPVFQPYQDWGFSLNLYLPSRETPAPGDFASYEVPLDLQAWLFGVGIHPVAMQLTHVAKATIYKYHLGLELVPKKNKEISICCDFKITLNRYLDTAVYPLPTQQDLFSTLAKGKYFSKLDLRNAYLQLEVDPGTRPLLTINTHKGLFRFKGMPFGLANAPSYFQSVMDRVLSGIGGVIYYIDDVLIATASIEKHLALLKTIFARWAKYNINLKKEKCLFLQNEIKYLGHLVTGEGIRPLDHKFIPNLPELLKPIHELLHKKRPWVWTKECGEAIDKCKNCITSERVLVPYDTTLPLCLATNASQIGVGAVLSHIIEGQERPIMFSSRTLLGAEHNYSQIEKEALAIIYGVTKSGIPTLSTTRLQRWELILSAYTYDIKFRRTQDHGNADLLSRFPVGCEEIPRLNNVYALSYVEELPITAKEIATETEKDEVLSLAKFYTQQGWPEKVADHLRPYFQRKLELSVDGECLVWGMRVVIPPSLRIKMLNCLLETHSGMNKMKAVARSHFWWPNLDTQIEFLVNKCRSCQQSQDGPNKGKWQPWRWSTRPWQRIHNDFANKENINLLIVVDSHSKWIEAIPMRETTTRKAIEQLRRLFSSYGLHEELVSDNEPQFTGSEMKSFLEGNGIKQTLIPAYHPQSNGLAERAVRTIKTTLDKKKRKIGDTIQDTLSKVILAYRSTPHVTTGKTPSELFIGRALRTRVSLIHPSLTSRVRDQQARQMKYDRLTHLEEFQIDDLVWYKNFRGGDKWIPGKIVGKKGTRVYIILIHRQVKAYHRDQIRKRWRNGEEDESGDGECQLENSRGAGLTSQQSDQDSEVQSDTDDGRSLEPLRSLDPETMREEGPVQRRNPPRARRPPRTRPARKCSENWRRFKQRLMLYLEATEKATKPDKLKVAILLNFIGEEALEVFNTFHLKEDEAENFDLLINKFDDFCEPKKNVIFERFKFFSATQKDGESIDSFITELKGLSTSCEFESQKDSLIRDRIVYGIQDKALQERLLREPNLTLLKAIEMCKTDEISKQQIKIMQNNQNICQIRKYEKRNTVQNKIKNLKKNSNAKAFCKSSAIRSLNDETEETVWSIHEAKVVHTLEWKKSIIVNGKEICFKLDSGAEVNVLPYTFTRQMKGLEIFQTNRKLTSYTGHEIKIKGIATLNCKTKNKTESLEFFIADGYYQPILGIEAIEKLSLIKKCDAVQTEQNNSAKENLNRHKNIFEGIGRLPIEHKIRLNENTTPVIAPSRKNPFSIREKVKAELERMEKLDIIEKVEEPSEWTHPIVVVQKLSGDVRICMDPRELNKYVQRERYILPTAETIFSELKESTNLCTIATPFGRFRFKRLPYGLNSASEVFQRCINNILSGLQGTACYMDDILIYGNTMEEHNRNLETVLRRLEENNVKLNAKKQQIAVDKVNFLGHIISRDGIAIQASRAEAIQKLKRPENKTEVQRFLGMVTYLGKFIPNLSDKTAPLRKLISNKSEWKFGGEENDCFEKLKNMVSNAPILTFFDPTKPITISSDASQYGIGTVLMQGGQAIEYASFSLNATQRKYAQIEKELLAIVFACERFQYYIWEMMLLDPLKDEVDTSYLEGQTESVHMLLVTTDEKIKRLQKETHGDHTLIQLIEYAKNGWPKYKTKVCDEAKPYWQFQDEIHVSDGIVYKGNCIMVPSTLRKEILQVVHSSHQGIAASKEKARSAFYWPSMITQVENEVEKCRTCQEYSRKNPEESRIAHEIPEFPWEKIAVDFMEVSGTSSILVVDYHSKFVEIRKLSSKRETETILQLKTIFRTHGIPRTLVSDNGPPFNSTGFKNFAQKYEFKHQTSSPKYPRSNGQVERTIQTIKGLIIKAVKSGRDPNLALMEFNNTPKYDLPSPTQMLMGRSVRTLSTYTRQQLKPLFDTTKNYQKLRDHQQKYAGSPKRILRPLEVGDNIMLQERHRKWVPQQNRSHLRPRKFSVEDSAPTSQSPSIPGSQAGTAMDDNIQDHGRPTSENRRAYDPRENVAKKGEESSTSPSVRTRSGRTVRKPLRYRD